MWKREEDIGKDIKNNNLRNTVLNKCKYFSFKKWEVKVRRSYFMFVYSFNLMYPVEIHILKSVFWEN